MKAICDEDTSFTIKHHQMCEQEKTKEMFNSMCVVCVLGRLAILNSLWPHGVVR